MKYIMRAGRILLYLVTGKIYYLWVFGNVYGYKKSADAGWSKCTHLWQVLLHYFMY